MEGVTTCDRGWVRIRLYKGENGPFLGIAEDYFEGHVFEAIATGISSLGTVAIKYSIAAE